MAEAAVDQLVREYAAIDAVAEDILSEKHQVKIVGCTLASVPGSLREGGRREPGTEARCTLLLP